MNTESELTTLRAEVERLQEAIAVTPKMLQLNAELLARAEQAEAERDDYKAIVAACYYAATDEYKCDLPGGIGDTPTEISILIARLKQSEVALEEANQRILDDNKAYGCELLDPAGTIWDHAKKLEAQLAETRRALADADIIAENTSLDGSREWKNETWLHRGQVLVVIERAAIDAARKQGGAKIERGDMLCECEEKLAKSEAALEEIQSALASAYNQVAPVVENFPVKPWEHIGDGRCRGQWAEDGSPYYFAVPVQLIPVFFALQKLAKLTEDAARAQQGKEQP